VHDPNALDAIGPENLDRRHEEAQHDAAPLAERLAGRVARQDVDVLLLRRVRRLALNEGL
jgi:hypothetical protein